MKRRRMSTKPALRLVIILSSLIMCMSIPDGNAADRKLSRQDMKALDGICGRLPGSTLGDAAWQALDPYIIKRNALRHLVVTCGDTCEGSLALRDGYFIDYSYTAKGKYGPGQPSSNSVYAIVLRRGDKTIQSYARQWEARRR
jgi:hypothetical protein